ncbi:hypothetical protein [Cedecea sp. NFIX57]|uniref:hypothetical protein n=1 Tax=Cedecea sp. NFIX57 TaxID=1566286 RepID=UPI000A0ABBCE|nr:hypothetical protein [Cedecea sp. NFIX57]SMG60197.1 hypothetical protein SAMN03159353_103438 [Cedecea sp. NFIX57]
MEALPIQVKLYIHFATSEFLSEKIIVSTGDMSRNNPEHYVLLEERTVTLNVKMPDAFEIIGRQVSGLRAAKELIAAKAHREQAAIDDKIQQLLCIDHSPIEESDIPF